MSIVGVPMLLGPILGPILGGWLVDDVSWRWIFFINVPSGSSRSRCAGASSRATSRGRRNKLDLLGLAMALPGSRCSSTGWRRRDARARHAAGARPDDRGRNAHRRLHPHALHAISR